MRKWHWKPIPNCPGRFALAGVRADLPPDELLGATLKSYEFDVKMARDRVVVVPFGRGGLISYKRKDGTYLHTLNDPEGFSRKLEQLGITLPAAI